MKKITDLGKKECILCTTQEECDIIMDMMHDAGLKWCNLKRYKNHRPNDYLPNQCYNPAKGQYGDKEIHKLLGYTIYPASEFVEQSDFIEKERKPKQGERILVRNSDKDEWDKRIFLCEVPQSAYSYLCVLDGEESAYLAGETVTSVSWKQIKQLPITSTYTIECTAEQYEKVKDLISK